MAEEELYEQINKLKISSNETTIIKQPKTDIPATINPFFKYEDSTTNKLELFGTKCSCKNRMRCTSESSLDDTRLLPNSTGIERKIIHSTQFKQKNSKILNNRRIPLLRDPILRSLHSSLFMKHIKSCCDCNKEIDNSANNTKILSEDRLSTIEALDLGNTRNISETDFCSLVKQCECLSLKKKKFIKSLSKDCLPKVSKKFSSVQNYETRSKQKQLNNTRSWRNITVSKHDPTNNNGNQSNNKSCSQEARINEGVASTSSQQATEESCDVTIDELASYFDTLVYIPKKMSSMAEMMYI